MKTRALRYLMLVPLVACCNLAAETSFVRQIQVIGGVNVVTDINAASDAGQVTSGTLSSDLSVFQLYTTYTDSNNQSVLLKLDEKSVGTFLPKVTIQTSSEDPYVPTTTRADRPYNVTVTVSGMLSGGSVPDYAKMVSLVSGYKMYSPTAYTPTGESFAYVNGTDYRTNGTYASTGIYQRLPGTSPTLAVGAETYSAHILPGSGTDLGQLATAEVVVLPAPVAMIQGILGEETGKIYNALPEEGSIQLLYAYPRSNSYAQIYKGPQVLGTAGMVIPSTSVQYNTTIPQDATLMLGSLADYIDEDGLYTIEVITVTPFNRGAPERLAYVTFHVKRTISINSMVATME